MMGSGVVLLTWAAHRSFLPALLQPCLWLSAVVLLALTAISGLRWVWKVDPERRERFLSTLSVLSAVLAALAGLQWGMESRFNAIEKRFAPLLQALEAYRAEYGRYPLQAQELVPGRLSALPSCYREQGPEGVGEGAEFLYGPADDGSFLITCYTAVFWKYTYDSRKGRWYGWD